MHVLGVPVGLVNIFPGRPQLRRSVTHGLRVGHGGEMKCYSWSDR